MAKNAEVSRKTSFITRSTKNLAASIDINEDAKFGKSDSSDNETIKRSPSKKLSKFIKYLILLHSRKRWVSFNSFGYDWGSQLKALPK